MNKPNCFRMAICARSLKKSSASRDRLSYQRVAKLARLAASDVNGSNLICINTPAFSMTKPDDQSGAKEAKSFRLEEAQRIISEYANELRETIQELRRKMN